MSMTGGGGGFGRRGPPADDGGGAFRARGGPVVAWSSWPHQGHRLWASLPDAFWVYVYKVQRCPQPRGHDWTLCPYAHWGERARRRDPRVHRYLAVSCPDYRASHEDHLVRGTGGAPACVRGVACRYAHGVFELWLHPERFRTRMCGAGRWCPRSVCFFAHFRAQLRREDDPVPSFVGGAPPPPLLPPAVIPRPPLPLPSPPPPPPPRPRRTRVIAPVSSLPRPGMMLQTRSGERLPLNIGSDDDYGASFSFFSSSAAPYAAAVADTPTPPVDNGSTSALGSSTSSSRRGAKEEEDPDDAEDDFPHLDSIMDILNSLTDC